MSQFNLMDLCRLCLDKDRVSIPIFEGEGVVKKLFMKIGACLPVKVAEDDRLPKKICDDCIYKVELVYSFWNTTANAEKQLLALLGDADSEPQVPSSTNSMKTDNNTIPKQERLLQGSSSGIARSLRRVETVLTEDGTSCIPRTNSSTVPGSTTLSNHPAMATPSSVRSSNERPLEHREDEESVLEEESEDEVAYSEDEDDPSVVGDGVRSFSTLEPAFVSVDLMGDGAGPSGLHDMEVETSANEGDIASMTQADEWDADVKPDVFDLSLFVQTNVTVGGLPISGCDSNRGGANSEDDADSSPSKRRSRRIVQKNALFPQVELREDQASSTSTQPQLEVQPKKEPADDPSQDSTDAEECAEAPASPASSSGSSSKPRKALGPLDCKDCGKSFQNARSLKQHSVVHSESRPYACAPCGKAYKRQYELSMHQRKHHPNQERLQCVMCDYSTIYRSALEQHLKRHTQEFKYRCEQCGKGFYVHKWLLEHQNVHTGEKPFKCDECDKSFPCHRYMVAHKKTSHPDEATPPKVYQCDTCGSVFAHRNSLRLHNKMHTGENVFICDICGKVLTSKDHLKLHRRIHTGEKPYACSYCEKAFSKKHTLTQHERVHTGERPYTCDQCGKSFSQRSTLVIHLRYHSGQRPYVCPRCDKAFVCTALLNAHLKNELC